MPISIQYDHKLNASFLLWVTNLVEGRGQAHTLTSGRFYDTQEVYSNTFAYSAPFQPFVADSSVGGATVMTGIYLDNTFIGTGSSGLVDINYAKGTVYFNSGITYANNPANNRLSGVFSVSDFSFKLTNEPEENLLFETKYSLRPKTTQTLSGIGPSEATFPIIYIKPNGSRNKEWALGGQENQTNSLRLVILADSQYTVDGVTSLIRDRTRCVLPLITGITEIPFNSYGGFAGPVYNYNSVFTGRYGTVNSAFLDDIRVTRIAGVALNELRKINPAVFVGIIDCDISTIRQPRI